jgi:hypothetical protein
MFGTWRVRDGDRVHASGAFQFERLFVRVTRWRVILVGAGAAAYLTGLLMHLPAEAVVPGEREAVGTVWKGTAGLEPGFAVGWAVRPLDSIAAFAPEVDLDVQGPDTAVAGKAAWTSGSLVLRDIRGVASLRLLAAAVPALPFACDGQATIRTTNLALGSGGTGDGLLRTGPSVCAASGTTAALPPLTAQARSDAQSFGLTARDPAGTELLVVSGARGNGFSVTVTPAGAAVLPGMSATTIEVR